MSTRTTQAALTAKLAEGRFPSLVSLAPQIRRSCVAPTASNLEVSPCGRNGPARAFEGEGTDTSEVRRNRGARLTHMKPIEYDQCQIPSDSGHHAGSAGFHNDPDVCW